MVAMSEPLELYVEHRLDALAHASASPRSTRSCRTCCSTSARWGSCTRSSGIDEDQALASLRHNENFQMLASVVLRQRDSWFHNFARGMAQSPNLVDQREVDEKRGYFRGSHVLRPAPAPHRGA